MDIFQSPATHLHRMVQPLVSKLSWKWRYLRWRVSGAGPYSDEYVQQVCADIDAGNNHGTLSVALYQPDLALQEATFVAQTVEKLGVRPSDICIDYGCGSLRVGEQIMKLLNPGNYIGLDVTDRFWKNGIQRLGAEFIAQYGPRLELIDERTERFAEIDARFLICIAVFIHVPPSELDDFVVRLAGIMGPGTTLLLDTRLGERTRQIHYRTWEHARPRAKQLFAKHGLESATPPVITRAGLPEELWVLRKR